MRTLTKRVRETLTVCGVLLLLPPGAHAALPNAGDLDKAVNAGDFGGYFADISAWLNQRAPADPSRISALAMKSLLKDAAFAKALAQRQLIAKLGAGQIGAFAKADRKNRTFLAWLMRDTSAMDLYLLGATPAPFSQRQANTWKLSTAPLNTWRDIYFADPDSSKGICLKLAIAVSLSPPGTDDRGVGQAEKPARPLDRYKHFKEAHKNGELFPSFDNLTVWEYRYVVRSNASDADLAWGREMVNTWQPAYRIGEKVVDTTRDVWRRGSPWPYKNGYRSVMEGGGKCGPRSSWAVFICQAFGIPAVGVRQPGHVCVCYKSLDGWKVAYGKSLQVSKIQGQSGPDWVAGAEARSRATQFSQVEHLRWLASALTTKQRASAVMAIADKIAKEKPAAKPAPPKAAGLPLKPEAPFKPAPGVIHVEAEGFTRMGGVVSYHGAQKPGVVVSNCYKGGKQLHFPSHMQTTWAEYAVNVPATGTYAVQMRAAAVNRGQVFDVAAVSAMPVAKSSRASNVYRGRIAQSGAGAALDDDPVTRWATDGNVKQAWMEVDLGREMEFSRVLIVEGTWNRVRKFQVQYKAGEAWKTILEGGRLGQRFEKEFPPVKARYVRLNILEATVGPTIYTFRLGVSPAKRKSVRVRLPNSYGLWATTPPVDINLNKGPQTLRVSTPFQRGVTLRWFELKPKTPAEKDAAAVDAVARIVLADLGGRPAITPTITWPTWAFGSWRTTRAGASCAGWASWPAVCRTGRSCARRSTRTIRETRGTSNPIRASRRSRCSRGCSDARCRRAPNGWR